MRSKLIESFFYYITSLPRYLGPVKYVLNFSVKILSGERNSVRVDNYCF